MIKRSLNATVTVCGFVVNSQHKIHYKVYTSPVSPSIFFFSQPDGTDLVNFTYGYSSWTSYLERMAKNGTWGDNLMLLAAANHFNTPIRIISSLPDHEDVIINPQSQVCHGADPLVLGHVHEQHYVSLLPLTGKAE